MKSASPSGPAPEPKIRQDESKRRAFVAAARVSFLTIGYAATTMSAVSAAVGGSKTTLWSYFRSKDELFEAVVEEILARHGKALSASLPVDEDMANILRSFGSALLQTLLQEEMLELRRLLAAESLRSPHLVEYFAARGPRRGKARLTEYFQAQIDRGAMRNGDPAIAADQFTALCRAGIYERAFLRLGTPPDQATIAATLDAAVETFFRGWKG